MRVYDGRTYIKNEATRVPCRDQQELCIPPDTPVKFGRYEASAYGPDLYKEMAFVDAKISNDWDAISYHVLGVRFPQPVASENVGRRTELGESGSIQGTGSSDAGLGVCERNLNCQAQCGPIVA